MISVFRGIFINVLSGIMLITCGTAMADAAELKIRIIDEPPVVLGQIVTVELSLQSQSPIVGAAKFTLPELEFGVWLDQSRASYNGFALRGGRRVPTLVTSYAVWIQKVGQFHLPAVQVAAPVLIDGERTSVQAQAPALPLLVSYPQAQYEPRAFLVAQQAQISSSADFPAQLSVGQVIEQTITISAQGALPVSFPVLDIVSSKSYRVDQLPVNSSVEYTRGVVTSMQTVTLRYTLLDSGEYQIPSCSLSWWDTGRHQFQTLHSQPYNISVNAADTVDDASMSASILAWLGGSFLGLLLAWGVVTYWTRVVFVFNRLKAPVLPDRLNP
jgi:hypothetical protein